MDTQKLKEQHHHHLQTSPSWSIGSSWSSIWIELPVEDWLVKAIIGTWGCRCKLATPTDECLELWGGGLLCKHKEATNKTKRGQWIILAHFTRGKDGKIIRRKFSKTYFMWCFMVSDAKAVTAADSSNSFSVASACEQSIKWANRFSRGQCGAEGRKNKEHEMNDTSWSELCLVQCLLSVTFFSMSFESKMSRKPRLCAWWSLA